jgi:hypothetical protein
MAGRRGRKAQAWIVLKADDPEAVSAEGVARAHLPAGETLVSLRRMRLFELAGGLPGRDELAELLHRSTQFYNPHKERCVVRTDADDAPPLQPGERAALVWERGGERRAAAERWWHHETGKRIEVREGVVWAMRFVGGDGRAAELTMLRDRRHGLLCNPHAQDCRLAEGEVPLPWWGPADGTDAGGGA